MRVLAGIVLAASLGLAQHHEMRPAVEKPVTLYRGLGLWHHSISTRNPEAQKFFDQGLALLYGFNRYEALRSFRKASELDPSAVMAYWGMAAALGPYVNMDGDPTFDPKGSCEALAAGRKAVAAATPEHERDYLEAIGAWCPEYQPAAYVAGMKRLAEKWPDDLDAQTLYAESIMIPARWHWYSKDGKPSEGMPDAEGTLEQVLRRWPEHPGANHYYIHAVESSPTPERAIPSAQRLMGIVPWAGHMVHMPAHIWLVMGEYGIAADSNDRASEVDRQYSSATNIKAGSYTPYYLHNLHFVVYARAMQGHRAQALEAARVIATAAGETAEMLGPTADYFLSHSIFARIRTLAWDEVLKTADPGEKLPYSRSIRHYGRALALLAKGDRTGAGKERELFESAAKVTPGDAQLSTNKAGDALKLAHEILAARFGESPVEHWRAAVSIQDDFVYDEPPAWYYPVRESLGAELVRSGQAAEGEKVLREGLRRSPRNGYILFGLMEALKAQGKDYEEVKREYDAVWAKSDVVLSLKTL